MAAKPRAVLIIGILAVAVGAVAATFLYTYLKSQEELVREAVETEQVVVASKAIVTGTTIDAAVIREIEWPKAAVPEGALLNSSDAIGRVALMSIQPGDPITSVKLMPKEGLPGIMSYRIPPGRRAMTVGVDQVSGVAGFITPGNMVDVVVTTKPSGYKDPVSKIFLQDVPVLATGQVIEQLPDGKPVIVPTVTLDVSPEDAEDLALASNEGKLQLILRRSGETGEVLTTGATVKEIVGERRRTPVRVKKAVLRRTVAKKRVAAPKPVVVAKKTPVPEVMVIEPRFIDVSVEVWRNGVKTIETFRIKGEVL